MYATIGNVALTGTGLKNLHSLFKELEMTNKVRIPKREILKLKPGTWLRIRWNDGPDNIGLLVSPIYNRPGDCSLPLFFPEHGTYNTHSVHTQIVEVLGTLTEVPKITFDLAYLQTLTPVKLKHLANTLMLTIRNDLDKSERVGKSPEPIRATIYEAGILDNPEALEGTPTYEALAGFVGEYY